MFIGVSKKEQGYLGGGGHGGENEVDSTTEHNNIYIILHGNEGDTRIYCPS